MAKLYRDFITLQAADFPKDNPLPDLRKDPDGKKKDKKALPVYEEDAERLSPGDGAVPSVLPYTMQDNYTRLKKKSEIPVLVLENSHLKATFVPNIGGKLWSLYDKDHEKELLSSNPVFQPANLAIRNAWTSGGIEYNCGLIGHTVFTVSPVFAETFEDEKRGPVLRMYEFERIRKAVYQLDFYLPEDSRLLYLKVQIFNPNGYDIPMYWWTNMAVEQKDGLRIIAPAKAYIGYDSLMHMTLTDYPNEEEPTADYPATFNRSREYFYYIDDSSRHFEAAIYKDGTGFVQASTSRQKGRKMFLWGLHQGGKRWQEYLSDENTAYVEIQAGLGRSQMEYVRMKANSSFSWTEVYGYIETDPRKTHGTREEAIAEAEEKLSLIITDEELEKENRDNSEMAVRKASPLLEGSPWGRLEILKRKKTGEGPLPSHLSFGTGKMTGLAESLRELLEDGTFPERGLFGGGFVTDAEWLPLLKNYSEKDGSDNPPLFEALGVLQYANNLLSDAEASWEKSKALSEEKHKKPGLVTMYCLAWIKTDNSENGCSFDVFRDVAEMYPECVSLMTETGKRAVKEGRERDFLALSESFPKETLENGRVKLLLSECCCACGRYEEAIPLLLDGADSADIREGETLLDELWYRIHEGIICRREGIDMAERNALSVDAMEKGAVLLRNDGRETDFGEIRRKAMEEFPLPAKLDFRMKNK